MKKHYLCCLILVLLTSSVLCDGQVITVRIVNAKNGHPVRKQTVSLSPLYEEGENVPANHDFDVRMETDANGQAQFNLPEPAPARLSVRAGLNMDHWRCLCAAPVFVATQGVIHDGVLEGLEFTTSANPVKAEPGQVVLVARKISLFEKLLSPLVKE
jgi:hypothetical protein